MGIVVVTIPGEQKRAFVNELHKRTQGGVDLVVIQVRRRPRALLQSARSAASMGFYACIKNAWYRFLLLIDGRARQALEYFRMTSIKASERTFIPRTIEVESVNSDDVYKEIKKLSPTLIAIWGSAIVQPRILTIAEKAINLHFGLCPYYRGAIANQVAVEREDLEKIGVTIHYAEEKMDAGGILATVTGDISKPPRELFCDLNDRAWHAYLDIACRLFSGESFPARKQDLARGEKCLLKYWTPEIRYKLGRKIIRWEEGALRHQRATVRASKIIILTLMICLVPAHSFAYTFSRLLRSGSSGQDVAELQKILKKDPSIYPEGVVSGYFGSATERAVQRFQITHGLATRDTPLSAGYGIVGPKTRAKLNEISGGTGAASQKLEVSGWIPYWRTATGTQEAMAHLDVFTEINPFGYTVKTDGTLNDPMNIDVPPWSTLIAAARAKKIRVVPTVMWSDTNAMHTILSNTKKRIALEDTIAQLVKEKNFDGIDIDFEGKRADDKEYFSTFLKGLYARMGKKWVMCTIEARTPIDSRYLGVPPPDAGQYANDFEAINKYCDRVRIMAYDQQSIDLKLNADADSKNITYAPVSDPRWVKKVMELTAKDIKKSKLVIGVATYGYEWAVTAYADGYTYDLLWPFNPGYALSIAEAYNITPARSASGELSFSYVPTSTPQAAGTVTHAQLAALAPLGASSGSSVATGARSLAEATNSHHSFRLMWWSDAQAIKDKIDLARALGVRGIAIFKIDGGADPALWTVVPQ